MTENPYLEQIRATGLRIHTLAGQASDLAKEGRFSEATDSLTELIYTAEDARNSLRGIPDLVPDRDRRATEQVIADIERQFATIGTLIGRLREGR